MTSPISSFNSILQNLLILHLNLFLSQKSTYFNTITFYNLFKEKFAVLVPYFEGSAKTPRLGNQHIIYITNTRFPKLKCAGFFFLNAVELFANGRHFVFLKKRGHCCKCEIHYILTL